MKVTLDCALCSFKRGCMEILEATKDPEIQLEAVQRLLCLLCEEFKPTAVPAVIGTMRERLIREVTGNPDPYAEKKRICNREALRILPYAERVISSRQDAESRFRMACLVAIVGNIIEFGIPGHEFTFEEINQLIQRAENELAIDDLSEAFKIAQKAKLILLLTDNAGEIAFDTLLVKELKKIAKNGKVIVGVKGKPAINDATLEDALSVGMDKVADEIVTTGSDVIGLIPSECSSDFLNVYEASDFVIAKGMAYAETLTELELRKPHLLLLRTKCPTVAGYFKVPRYRNVAKLILKNFEQ
ncbi:DUF89 family protein [Candidatus Bathyarchaeota archaeon]|nr:MAG: DUF89 family protein [Candidatus Bathyarchaeota archaeon]